MLRSEAANLRLAGAVTHREQRDYVLDAELRNRGLTIAEIGLQGDRRDTWGGGGVNYASVVLKRGFIKLRNSFDIQADQAGPQVQGFFTEVAFSAGRSQVITPKSYLSVFFAGQWANKNMDSSERFTLGGPTNVRGYPVSEATGDRGYLLKLELVRDFSNAWKGFTFVDTGRITVDSAPWAGSSSPNTYSLHSVGLGARWSNPAGWKFEGTLAIPVRHNPTVAGSSLNQDGSKYGPRLWVRLNKSF